jgi:hypothetical protein
MAAMFTCGTQSFTEPVFLRAFPGSNVNEPVFLRARCGNIKLRGSEPVFLRAGPKISVRLYFCVRVAEISSCAVQMSVGLYFFVRVHVPLKYLPAQSKCQ